MSAARKCGALSRCRAALSIRNALVATTCATLLPGTAVGADIPDSRETVPVERISCPPQDFAEIELAGRTFTIPAKAARESLGRGAPDAPGPDVGIASLIVPGKAKEVSVLYRCLLQQSGYGLVASERSDTAPVYFNDGMALSGQIFIGQILDAEDDLTRVVIVARTEPATGN